MDALYQFGISLIQSIQALSPGLDGIMKGFTFLGTVEFYLIFIPFIYWAVDRRIGVRTLLILIYTDFIASSFKLLFHEPRPYWVGDVKALGAETSYGIPSSHSSDSLAVGGYLLKQVKQSWIRWLIGFSVLWAVAKWETVLRNWLDEQSLSTQIVLGFADSILMVLIGFIIRFMIAGTPDPAEWSSFSTEARTVNQFITLAGAAFGTFTGYALMRKYASFNAKGDWTKRGIRYLIGIVGLLVLYFGLDLAFAAIAPDASTLGYILRYIRYGLATFWATFLAPWVFLKIKLAEAE